MEIKPAVGIRRSVCPYHVYLTWDLTYDCNYSCSYCSLGKGEDRARKPVTIVKDPGAWRGIWRDIYEKYGSAEVHLSGGEPFFYPEIMKIIEYLVEMHTFECSTNLYWDVDEFIKIVPPDRARVGTSYHPEMVDFEDLQN